MDDFREPGLKSGVIARKNGPDKPKTGDTGSGGGGGCGGGGGSSSSSIGSSF